MKLTKVSQKDLPKLIRQSRKDRFYGAVRNAEQVEHLWYSQEILDFDETFDEYRWDGRDSTGSGSTYYPI